MNRLQKFSPSEGRKTRRFEILPESNDVKLQSHSSLWRAVDTSSKDATDTSLLFIAGDSMHTDLVRMVLNSCGFALRELTELSGHLASPATEAPSLILLDWDTDGVDGNAVLNDFRSNPLLRRVPVIVMTNRSVTQRWCGELAKYCVSWVLEKPIVALSLPKLIQRTISARGHALQGCQVERSALLVECGQTASGALYKSIV